MTEAIPVPDVERLLTTEVGSVMRARRSRYLR
jgi:hypothetical protein